MKNISKLIGGLLIFAIFTASCDTLLDVNSDGLVLPEDNQLNSPNDTLYSMLGIFTKMEKLAERYVLLGELRGDLMDVSADANLDLREIYNFNISKDNKYNAPEDYYAVINNCNYLINTIDTSLMLSAEKIMYKEFAAAKSIRAWTYLQLVLNYGSVKYYENAILTIQDTANYEWYTLDQLLPELIQDLEPWTTIDEPGGIDLGASVKSEKLFFPVNFVLGDLYLWNGDYELAAKSYYNLILEEEIVVSENNVSEWTVSNGVFVSRDVSKQLWSDNFGFDNASQITMIAGPAEFGEGAFLDSISLYQKHIFPSQVAIDNWNNQTYYSSATVFNDGDLRGPYGSYINADVKRILDEEIMEIEEDFADFNNNEILKFHYYTSEDAWAIPVYRATTLYLRYAEAVNRVGKPNLAFAVLKNGLNINTMIIDSIVPVEEIALFTSDTTATLIDYVNFFDITFLLNVGVHETGCGNAHLSYEYKIEAQSSKEDSILFVEEKIIEELALETAFEGNRFQDLMRISLRRGDPAFLADRVSAKYVDQEGVRALLMDENNWYLK